MKKFTPAFAVAIFGAITALLTLGASSPVTLSVQTLTNGVVYRPTNFWDVNSTSIVTAIQGQIATGQVQLSFSSDFIVSAQTNVALAASNLANTLTALSNRLSSSTNYLGTNFSSVLAYSTNKVETNVLARIDYETNALTARINYETNRLTTNILATVTNMLAGFTNFGLVYNPGVLYDLNDNTNINITHGLGGTPLVVRWVLVCQTNDNFFKVGDEVDASAFRYTTEQHFSWGANTTNVFFSTWTGTLYVNAKNGSVGDGTVDLPSWKVKVYAIR